jgi:hypothetical protein
MMKRASLLCLVLLAFAAFVVNFAFSDPGGKTGTTLKTTTTGCSCHCSVKNAATTVTIATNDTTFEVGKTYTFTLTVANASELRGGCNIAVKRGTLTAGTDGLKKLGNELTHKSPKQQMPAIWTFTYTAPATAGGDTIYATGNAVNGDGSEDGGSCADKWNHAPNFVINVKAGASKTLAVSKSTIDLGKIRVGTQASDTLSLRSTGEAPITITSSAMKKGLPYSAKPTGSNRQVAIGASETDTIIFSPTARGSFIDTFVVNTNATVQSDIRKTVVVKGQGIQAVLSCDSAFIMEMKIGTTKDSVFTVHNTGDDTLFFLSQPFLKWDHFQIVSPLPTLVYPPDASGELTLRFSAASDSVFLDSLIFPLANGVKGKNVTLVGAGVQGKLSVASLVDFGKVKINSKVSKQLMLYNIGRASLTITSILMNGSNKFALVGAPPGLIPPMDNATLTVEYEPDAVGHDTATLIIGNDNQDTPTAGVTLAGEGVTNEAVHSIANADILSLDVFPNPAQNSLHIRMPSGQDITGHLEIFDASAKLVMSTNETRFSFSSENEINVTGLANGEYYLRLICNGVAAAETKFIISR